MQLIRGLHHSLNLSCKYFHEQCSNGIALTIGNFDGVHKGHQALIKKLRVEAQGLPIAIMIFEPQPLEYFNIEKAPARITHFRDKVIALEKLGIDYLFVIRFNSGLASLSPVVFVKDLLINKLNVKSLLVGDDFKFGAKRQGDFNLLKSYSTVYDFTVKDLNTVMVDQQRVSSTSIREALLANKLDLAATLLGRSYSISGRVIHGDKIGAQIGFPTANIAMKRHLSPVKGVYAVEITGNSIKELTGLDYVEGIANIGNRPTVAGKKHLLEVHIFDKTLNLYGHHLEIVLRKKIRDEQKFAGLAALQDQIKLDIQSARDFFKSL